MRPPSVRCTWRKWMSWFSVAEYRRTGTLTRPKETAPFQIARMWSSRGCACTPAYADLSCRSLRRESAQRANLEGRQDGPMRPMLATLTETVPTGDEWVHEVKWDGMRLLADAKGGGLTLTSRS